MSAFSCRRGSPPRTRFDGRQIEFWSYVSDYARKLDTTITFVDGRVTEIRATTWQEAD